MDAYKANKGHFDVLIEASGNAKALVAAFEVLRPRGVIVQVGTGGDTTIPMNVLVAKEFEWRGTFRFHEEFALAVALMNQRRVDVKPLISHSLPHTEYARAFALAADIRIAGESARMNAAFIKLGLSSCDMGVSYFLPRLVGSSVASEYLLTGKFMSAEKALACGLLSEIVPADELLDKALALAGEMLLTSPMGLRLTKEALNHAIDANGLEATIAMEDRNQILASSDGDFAEGVRAFLEKREPQFRDQASRMPARRPRVARGASRSSSVS